jgi:hypothetical protein
LRRATRLIVNFDTIFVQCFQGEKKFKKFPAGTDSDGGSKARWAKIRAEKE